MSKVFIIDDDPIHQRIIQIMVTKHYIFDEYVSFTNAEQALDYLVNHSESPEQLPDVILLDLNMPEIDGWDFLDRYQAIRKQIDKDIKIYIVSSSVDEKDILRSKSYSYVNGFISKPLSADILRDTAKL